MQHNRIVSQDAWLAAHKRYLIKAKELMRLRDQSSLALAIRGCGPRLVAAPRGDQGGYNESKK